MGSNPALATPEHGQQFYELAVKELSNSYLSFEFSDWVIYLSLSLAGM